MTSTVLVVDDESHVRSVVSTELTRLGLSVIEAEDGVQGWKRFRQAPPDLVISDLRMPNSDGIDFLRQIRSVSNIPVLLLTAYADIPSAVAAVKSGAQDFLEYPDAIDRLPDIVRTLLKEHHRPPAESLEQKVVGKSSAMQRIRRQVAGLAPLHSVPVLVQGELGTGRSLVVETLHAHSDHRDKPLHRINCAGSQSRVIPDGVKALYFENLSDLSTREQASVHAAILQGQLAHTRLYASTNIDVAPSSSTESVLPELLKYFARFSISLPPLRSHLSDVPQLVAHLCQQLGHRLGRTARVTPAGVARLKQYSWPENVAELETVLEQLIAFSPDGTITKQHISEALGQLSTNVLSARQQREREQREELMLLLDETGGNLAEIGRRLNLRPSSVAYRAKKFGLFPSSSR